MAEKTGLMMRWVSGAMLAGLVVLPAAPALGSPITIEFTSSSKSSGGLRVVGTAEVMSGQTFDLPQVMAVPGFDSSLGTLLSAHLTIDEVFHSRVFDHSQGNALLGAPAYFQHSGRAYLSLETYSALQAILQFSHTPDFNLNMFQTYASIEGEDKTGVNAYAEIRRDRASSRSFDEVFLGDALAAFLDVGPLGYFSNGSRYLSFEGQHTGHFLGNAVSSALNPPTTMSPGTKPGVGTVALLTLSLINAAEEQETGHELFYSDMHVALAAELSMTVSYTYEPFAAGAAVPEPATLALLATGLAVLGLRARRRARSRLL